MILFKINNLHLKVAFPASQNHFKIFQFISKSRWASKESTWRVGRKVLGLWTSGNEGAARLGVAERSCQLLTAPSAAVEVGGLGTWRWNLATGNAIATRGRVINPGPAANYIGAAWHNNTRIVWWTSVVLRYCSKLTQ